MITRSEIFEDLMFFNRDQILQEIYKLAWNGAAVAQEDVGAGSRA